MSLRAKATTQVVPDSLLKTTRIEQRAKKDEQIAKKNAAAEQIAQKQSASAKRVAEQMDKQSKQEKINLLRPDLLSSEKNSHLPPKPTKKRQTKRKEKVAEGAQTLRVSSKHTEDINMVSPDLSPTGSLSVDDDLLDQGLVLGSDIDNLEAEVEDLIPKDVSIGSDSDSDSDAEEIRKLEEALAEKARKKAERKVCYIHHTFTF